MTFPRKTGLLLLVAALAAAAGHEAGLALPSLGWFFSFGEVPGTEGLFESWTFLPADWRSDQARVLGHLICTCFAILGLTLIARGGDFQWNPLTVRKFARFRLISRGWVAFRLLMLVVILAMLDQALVGAKALAVKYDGKWFFPAFQQKRFIERDFGGAEDQNPNYREMHERFQKENSGNRVILAPIPWDPTFDSDEILRRPLVETEGKLYRGDHLYDGEATRFLASDSKVKERSARYRKGVRDGTSSLYAGNGEFIGRETWKEGVLLETSAPADLAAKEAGPWMELIYPPAPPSWKERHYLGTDSKGWDIAAQMYGGLQVILKASVFYLFLTYSIGILVGGLSGYFGGITDLVSQRLIEILSNVPFLLVVMIISANIGRDNISLVSILSIFCIFSWITVATYLRTSTLKEKARDYVAAARVQGAGTTRILFRHILPNALSPLVTLLPFSVVGLTSLLTALDFLGFGVPDRYPSWGRVLEEGASNLAAPWIVSSVFAVMVSLLLIVTFIGEAIREAFDPKKFTTYQ